MRVQLIKVVKIDLQMCIGQQKLLFSTQFCRVEVEVQILTIRSVFFYDQTYQQNSRGYHPLNNAEHQQLFFEKQFIVSILSHFYLIHKFLIIEYILMLSAFSCGC